MVLPHQLIITKMNIFDRALIEKTAIEHGWENVLRSTSEEIIFASSRHQAQARITPDKHLGLVSFAGSGELICSPRLDACHRSSLQINNNQQLRWITPEHESFLSWHREKVFKQ